MRAILTLILLVLAVSSVEARAPSKDRVAANCLSQSAARAAYPGSHLRYRVVGGRHCWYAPGKAIVAKRVQPKSVRVATLKPELLPVVVAPPPVVMDMTRIEQALCGGPCPRFDLDSGPDRATYRALCGGPCPDFRQRFDSAFEAFGLSR